MLNLGSRLSDLVSDIVLTTVHVTQVEDLTNRFTRVRLQGRNFQRSRWTPGDKLQLRVRSGSVDLRTYTPINWDAEHGTTDLIAFGHGEGPGARWFNSASTGVACEVFGPSQSINLSDAANAVVFIGDETSVPLAQALRSVTPIARFLFETEDPCALHSVLTALEFVDDFEIIVKSKDRRTVLQCAREAAEQCTGGYDLVVSGDAATVSVVRRSARNWPHRPTRIKARAYWARGRTGLS